MEVGSDLVGLAGTESVALSATGLGLDRRRGGSIERVGGQLKGWEVDVTGEWGCAIASGKKSLERADRDKSVRPIAEKM